MSSIVNLHFEVEALKRYVANWRLRRHASGLYGADPGQHQKARVVGQQPQVRLPRAAIPSDPCVARRLAEPNSAQPTGRGQMAVLSEFNGVFRSVRRAFRQAGLG